jgi:hypothetical protein
MLPRTVRGSHCSRVLSQQDSIAGRTLLNIVVHSYRHIDAVGYCMLFGEFPPTIVAFWQ